MESLEDRQMLTTFGINTIVSTVAEAGEANQNYGSWEITRTGSVDYPCSVSFRMSGTALAGSDYNLFNANGIDIPLTSSFDQDTQSHYYSGTVLFDEYSSSKTILLRPFNDSRRESAETALIQLVSYFVEM